MRDQAAMRGCGGRRDQRLARQGPRGIDAGQAPHGCRFGISFYAHKLPGKKERAARLELQRVQQELGGVDERIAMQASIPEELSLFQPWDHAKHALLFRIGQFGLKAHQVVTGAMNIFGPQLDDGSGLTSRSVDPSRPTGFIGPNCIVWRPRSAITSIGIQASKYGVFSNSFGCTFSAAIMAS